jgi:murein DD-endopeptidase MepM/ murein hydrolase activator NlpD
MRTPIDGARMSSGFGMRRHPVLGYSRMHRGTDFAAPTGTPIYAAGNGTIDFIGNNRGYGRYVRIRHSGGLATAYAHMSRFAKGLERGSRVEQGEVIGYVGTTGLSTGPHLHYEVLQNGTQINPMAVDLPTGRNLEGSELAAFRAAADDIDRQFALMAAGTQVAESPGQ